MKIKKLLFVLVLILAFISCDKSDEKIIDKKTLIENLDLFQTSWSGTYTDAFNGYNQAKIQLSFYSAKQVDCAISSPAGGIYWYTHTKNIINITPENTIDYILGGSWWINDITENTLLLHRGVESGNPDDLDVLELTKVY